jgi:hypothetical protein
MAVRLRSVGCVLAGVVLALAGIAVFARLSHEPGRTSYEPVLWQLQGKKQAHLNLRGVDRPALPLAVPALGDCIVEPAKTPKVQVDEGARFVAITIRVPVASADRDLWTTLVGDDCEGGRYSDLLLDPPVEARTVALDRPLGQRRLFIGQVGGVEVYAPRWLRRS